MRSIRLLRKQFSKAQRHCQKLSWGFLLLHHLQQFSRRTFTLQFYVEHVKHRLHHFPQRLAGCFSAHSLTSSERNSKPLFSKQRSMWENLFLD